MTTVIDMLKIEIGEILRMAPDKIDATLSMQHMGLDSLMGVELVVAVENRFGTRLPVMALSDSPTVAKLAAWIITQLRGDETPGPSHADTRWRPRSNASRPSMPPRLQDTDIERSAANTAARAQRRRTGG